MCHRCKGGCQNPSLTDLTLKVRVLTMAKVKTRMKATVKTMVKTVVKTKAKVGW